MDLGTLKLPNNLFLAPLAGITDTVFRILSKRYGCGLVFSEMINSNGVLRGGISLLQKMDIHPDEGVSGIQIAGDDPHILSEAAKLAIDNGAATININMGCPSKKVTKNQAGCALMKDPSLVQKIIKEVRKSISVPLTVKIRLGWDKKNINYLEVSKIIEEEGCDGIMMHARTKEDGFSGQARWEEIKKLKEARKIPVIGNGDVTSAESALSLLSQTGCDGIMIGRGALGSPWIFKQISDLQEGKKISEPPLEERKKLILEHLSLLITRYGENLGLRLMQKHFGWYSKGLPNSCHFRTKIHEQKDLSTTIQFVEEFFLPLTNSQYLAQFKK